MEKNIDKKLKDYIEKNIIPEYSLNDKGHNEEHVRFVLKRAFEISKEHELDENMLYIVVCFHDIACHIDRENHEKLSAERLFGDKFLWEMFDRENMQIMKEAVEDHRASLEYVPRNIYGKILSSADRKIDVDIYLKSSMGFSYKKNPNLTDEELIEESYVFAIKKFGKDGYATKKMYVNDKKYKEFLELMQYLIDNKDEYVIRARKILKDIKE